MSKYKIVKKYHKVNGRERFIPMKRYFGFWWVDISESRNGEYNLADAEKIISYQKKVDETRKKKPEVVGYY